MRILHSIKCKLNFSIGKCLFYWKIGMYIGSIRTISRQQRRKQNIVGSQCRNYYRSLLYNRKARKCLDTIFMSLGIEPVNFLIYWFKV